MKTSVYKKICKLFISLSLIVFPSQALFSQSNDTLRSFDNFHGGIRNGDPGFISSVYLSEQSASGEIMYQVLKYGIKDETKGIGRQTIVVRTWDCSLGAITKESEYSTYQSQDYYNPNTPPVPAGRVFSIGSQYYITICFDTSSVSFIELSSGLEKTKVAKPAGTSFEYFYLRYSPDNRYLVQDPFLFDIVQSKNIPFPTQTSYKIYDYLFGPQDSVVYGMGEINNTDSIRLYEFNIAKNKIVDSTRTCFYKTSIDRTSGLLYSLSEDAKSLSLHVTKSKSISIRLSGEVVGVSVNVASKTACIETSSLVGDSSTNSLAIWRYEPDAIIRRVGLKTMAGAGGYSELNSQYSISNTSTMLAYFERDSMYVRSLLNDSLLFSVYFRYDKNVTLSHISFLSDGALRVYKAVSTNVNWKYTHGFLWIPQWKYFDINSSPTFVSKDNTSVFFLSDKVERRRTNDLSLASTIPKSGFSMLVSGLDVSTTGKNLYLQGSASLTLFRDVFANVSWATRPSTYKAKPLPDGSKVYSQVREYGLGDSSTVILNGNTLDSIGSLSTLRSIKFQSISNDSRFALTSEFLDSSSTLSLRDANSLTVLKKHWLKSIFTSAVISKNDSIVAFVARDGNMSLWYPYAAKDSVSVIRDGLIFGQKLLAFSNSNAFVYTDVGVFNCANGRHFDYNNGKSSNFARYVGLYDHDSLLVIPFESGLYYYDLASNSEKSFEIPGHIFVHPHLPYYCVFSESANEGASLYDLRTRTLLSTVNNLKPPYFFHWTDDATQITVVDSSQKLVIWRPKNLQLTTELRENADAVSAQGCTLLEVNSDNTVTIPAWLSAVQTRALVHMMDSRGRTIYSREFVSSPSSEMRLDLSQCAQGEYFIVVQPTDSSHQSRLFAVRVLR